MVHVLSVVASRVSSHSDGLLLVLGGSIGLLALIMMAAGTVVVAMDLWEGHCNLMAKMRQKPVQNWGRTATDWFETAPDANEVAFASDPHGCMTVIRPTFVPEVPVASLRRPAPPAEVRPAATTWRASFLEVPEFNPELMRTVVAKRRKAS